jgi:site-specific DNA recombinase
MMRTVIYARFSSSLQNSQSIDQQIEACRKRCEAEGWEIVEQPFTDYALSGGAGTADHQRPGLAAMLSRVEQGDIDQVLVDTTSRVARNQGDAHHIRDRINYHGARLFTLGDGEIDRFKGAIKGLLDEQQRTELRHNIKRGQTGTVKQGRSPAGLAYGYRMANRIDEATGRPIRGLRAVDDEKAEIVRRIFREYSEGKSPVAIAKGLNADGIPGPSGSHWRASAIRPDNTRGNGILCNRIYIGRIIHNRTSKVIEPVSRNIRIRPNHADDWQKSEYQEHLRIIDDALFEQVQAAVQSNRIYPGPRARRARHLFSGLGVCGVCGGPWNVKTATFWGCGGRSEGNGCTNNRNISTASYEARVLSGLKDTMLDPELVSLFVREYHAEYARKAADYRRQLAGLERRKGEAVRKIDRLVAAIEAGADIEEVKAALTKAREDRNAAKAQIDEIEAFPVVALHPTIAEDYRRQVRELHLALADDEARPQAVPAVRNLIDRIVLTPNSEGRGVSIEVEGKLAAIVELATGNQRSELLTVPQQATGTAQIRGWLRAKS